jgi:hypothetical protein
MTRHLPVFARAFILLSVTMLLGTAIAQEPLPLPPAADVPAETDQIPSPESTAEPVLPADPLPVVPTVEPFVPPDGGLGRFDPDNLDALPEAQNEARGVMTRGHYDASKLDSQLAELMERFVRGDVDGSEAVARNYWLPRDRKGRYLVIVWAAEGVRAKGVSKRVGAAGGKIDNVDRKAVYARLDKPQIALLSTDPKVGLIQPQPVGRAEPEATSAIEGRTPAGAIVSEGFDIANAMTWHNAGNTGASVNIAIIDFGFGGNANANPELTCLNSYPSVNLAFGGVPTAGEIRRGLDIAEVICDIAPGAKVRLYKVTTSNDLYDAITAAKNNNDIIVIGAEFGANFSPGDGTFGRSSNKNVYQALATAKASGVTVIAAAGNSNRVYRTFTMLQGGGNVTVAISAKPGDQVNISWNDWDSQPNNGGVREDLNITLTGSGVNVGNSARPAGANPARQIIIPSCTLTAGFCNLNLNLSGISGNPVSGELIVQVNVSGGLDRQITNVTGAPVNWFGGLNQAPTLSRPADSPHVIAVGAVCSNYKGNFPLENYSGVGPKFNPGGGFNGRPADDFYGPHEVKPEIVGPSNVSVFNNEVGISEFETCTSGFRGTQASAAHVAGMTALLLNNSLVSGFNGLNAPLNILHYWRTHSVDMPLVVNPKGYDMEYGAGLAVLGMPDYDYDKSLNAPLYATPNRLPPGECFIDGDPVAKVTYVGPRNAGNSDYDGTVNYPFQSIAHAAHIQASAGGNRCVIVLPGEYVTPVLFDQLSNPADVSVGVFGYSAVTLNAGVERSTLVVQNKYWEPVGSDFKRRAGVFVNDSSNLVFGGFNFVTGDVYDGSAFQSPSIVAAKNSPGFSQIRSRFNGIATNRPLVEIFDGSHGATVSDNRFVNNNGLSGGSIVAVYDSGTDTARVSIRGNRFQGNVTNDGSWPMISVPNSISWVPMIRSLDSYTDVVNNTISGNTAESLLQGATTAADMPYEFRVLGNAIVGNTISSSEFTPPGPLIHGFYQRYIMIVNNTIAQNQFLNSGEPYNSLFARGDDIPNNGGALMNGSLAHAHARWEIHGNLIVGNGSSVIVREMDADFTSGAGCISFAGIADQGASYNWIFNSYSGSTGDCNTALQANNNILNVNPSGGILGGPNPNDPAYWAPNGNTSAPKNITDGGPTAFVTGLMPFFANTDVRGDARINNLAVDIGAYEFTTFEILNGGQISIVGNEDSGVVEFDINDPIYITGGFPPYTATLVDAPDYYGTGCDSRFASPGTQGSAVEAIDDNTLTIAYCPPHQFHTNTSDEDLTGNPPRMIVDIHDAVGNTVQAIITYTINPVNDDPLTTPIHSAAAVAIQRNATHPSGTNQVRLRPYVDFAGDTLLNGSKFYFSEWLNATGTAADGSDYDYTYPSLPTLLAGDPSNVNTDSIVNNLVWVDQSRGILGVNLGAVATPATAKLRYTVQDANGNTVTVNTVLVRAVPAPAPFALLAPVDGFSVGNIDSFGGFTWEVSANAQTYELVIARKIEPPYIEILRLTGLTPQADADGLICTATCALELTDAQKLNLIDGEYRWAVYANNQGLRVRSNDQFDFVVAAGRELLLNGGFEVQGTTTKLAADWKLNKGTKDQRTCGTGAASGACFFNFTANASTSATLVQKLPGLGRKGDTLTLTTAIKTTKLKAGTGVLQVIVKYTTGDKDKITLTAPSGTQNFALASAPPLVLRFPVANYKVKLQIRTGKGKMALDNVSLNLDEKIEFDLLTPTDGTVSASAANVTQLTWQPSASAPSYQVLLLETANSVTPTPVINAVRTAAADADNLTCAGGQCVLTLAAPLANGDYVWTVTASNGFEAENAPFSFSIDSINRTELVVNGGFEANNGKNVPGTWKVGKLGKSASVCENGATHPEYQGACAFAFVGGNSTKLSQNLSTAGLASGHILTLSVSAELQRAVPGAQIKLTVTNNNGTKDTRKINLPSLTQPWQTYTAAPLAVGGNVSKVALTLNYKGGSGKVLLDNVSVIRSTQ